VRDDLGKMRVMFLLPPRREVAQLAKSLCSALAEHNIAVLPIIAETRRGTYEPIDKIFSSSKIEYKKISDYGDSTAIEILLKERPNLLITDNDLLNLISPFIFSGKHVKIPTMVIRENASLLVTKINFLWTFSEIFMKLNQLPRLLKTYWFYIKSMASIKPNILNNPLRLLIILLRGFDGQIIGQNSDYILTATSDDALFLRSVCLYARFIRPVGNPRFDLSFDIQESEFLNAKSYIHQKFQIPTNKKIILFLSSSRIEHGMSTKEQVLTANRKILSVLEKLKDDAAVIIKLHPMEKNTFPLIWKPDYNYFIHVTRFDLSKLILASDLVMSWFSTALINVVTARKPLVIIDFFGDRSIDILLSMQAIADHRAALEASDEDELYRCISSLLRDTQLRKRLELSQETFHSTYLKTIDGNSIQRICESIREVLSKEQN
jgi:hypothetical protein